MLLEELLAPPLPLPPLERVITPDVVGGSGAWQTLIRDGALKPLLGDTALPVNVMETPTLRALCVPRIVPQIAADSQRIVVAGLCAAWIWLGGSAPGEIEVVCTRGKFQAELRGVRARSALATSSETSSLNGVLVTSPVRTIRDLALWHPAAVAIPLIIDLVQAGVSLVEAGVLLEQRLRLNGRPQARQTLASVAELNQYALIS